MLAIWQQLPCDDAARAAGSDLCVWVTFFTRTLDYRVRQEGSKWSLVARNMMVVNL